MQRKSEFELTNVGSGPDPLSLSALANEQDFILLLFQRDFYCTNCREQIQTVAKRYEQFQERNTEVVSIVPEPAEKLAKWQEQYDLPYPLCADPDATFSGEYDQPVRFGVLGKLSDFFGRMPKAVLLDCRGEEPSVVYSHEGSSTWDRPEIDELLDAIDSNR